MHVSLRCAYFVMQNIKIFIFLCLRPFTGANTNIIKKKHVHDKNDTHSLGKIMNKLL